MAHHASELPQTCPKDPGTKSLPDFYQYCWLIRGASYVYDAVAAGRIRIELRQISQGCRTYSPCWRRLSLEGTYKDAVAQDQPVSKISFKIDVQQTSAITTLSLVVRTEPCKTLISPSESKIICIKMKHCVCINMKQS